MTGQNIPGVAVMASLGYRAPAARGAALHRCHRHRHAPAWAATPPTWPPSRRRSPPVPTRTRTSARRWPAGIANGVSGICLGVAATAVTDRRGRGPRRRARDGGRAGAARHLRRLRGRRAGRPATPRGGRGHVRRGGVRLRRSAASVPRSGRSSPAVWCWPSPESAASPTTSSSSHSRSGARRSGRCRCRCRRRSGPGRDPCRRRRRRPRRPRGRRRRTSARRAGARC